MIELIIGLTICVVGIALTPIVNKMYHKYDNKRLLLNTTTDMLINLCKESINFIIYGFPNNYQNIKKQLDISSTYCDENENLLSKDIKDIFTRIKTLCDDVCKKGSDRVFYITFGDEPRKTPLKELCASEADELNKLMEQLKKLKR